MKEYSIEIILEEAQEQKIRSEHYVIHVLRDDPAFVPELDFVMEQDGKLIGQNIFMKKEEYYGMEAEVY